MRRQTSITIRPRAAAALLCATLALAPACTKNETTGRRVSIYGVDGATWNVIDPMLSNGELPNLARMIRGGVRAPLRSRKPLVSPPVWTTIATGVTRDVHGIENFVVTGEGAFTRTGGRLASSQDRRVHALWTIASAYGLNSAVLGWWATYPAETIKGAVVSERALKTREIDLSSQFGGRAVKDFGLVHPPEMLDELVAIINEAPANKSDPHDRENVLRSMQIEDEALARALQVLRDQRGPFQLEMVLMRGVDVVSHHFWKFHEPDAAAYEESDRPSPEEVERLGTTVTDHYRLVDRLIGELTAANRPDDVVLVVSDHGFEAGMQPFRKGTLSGTHKSDDALNGIFIAAGGPFRKGATLESASILDVAPTALHVLGLPLSEQMSGAVLESALEPSWLAGRKIKKVARYEGKPVLLPEAAVSDHSPVDDAVMEQLRRLGYVE